jgi:hypothetical protein
VEHDDATSRVFGNVAKSRLSRASRRRQRLFGAAAGASLLALR